MILQLGTEQPSPYHLDRIVTFLEDDGVVAIPTDTIYALACLPDRKAAVAKLMALRRLDARKPLALVFRDVAHISEFTLVDNQAFRVLRRYLPGPYTFVLEARRGLPRYIGDRRKRIGVRIPEHKIPVSLVDAVGKPLIVTSAVDPDTQLHLTDPWSVENVFGHGLSATVDCGDSHFGLSTVIDLTESPPTLLRQGLGDAGEFDSQVE